MRNQLTFFRVFFLVLTAVHVVGAYFLFSLWIASDRMRWFLTVISYPVGIAVLTALVAAAYACLPVGKVPLSYNLRNLQIRWKTTVMTGLAFTLVVFLVTVMLAFVLAMYRMTQESGVPGNVIILSDGANDEVISNLAKGVSVSLAPDEIQAAIERDEKGNFLAVREVYAIVNHVIPDAPAGGRKGRFIQMRGLDNPYTAARVHQIQLQPGGRWWSDSGVQERTNMSLIEVVVGDGIARTFGQDRGQTSLKLGDVLKIGPREWIVVGIMEPSGSSFGNEIWAKDDQVQGTYKRDNYNSYVVRTKDEETAKKGVALIKSWRLGDKSFAAFTEMEYYERLSQTSNQFLIAFIFVAIIMAIGGILGVMNTMFAAISQRTKDIGVLRLLGYTRWQILMSFLLESLVIGLVGGLVGCALGYVLADGYVVSSIVSAGQGGGGKSVVLKLIVNPELLGIGMGFSLVMGAMGGFLPAVSAMRLKPLESLR
jgi:putative ABC transport system permease protein